MRLIPLLYTALVGTSLNAQEVGHNLADFQKMARTQPHHYPAGKIKTMIVVDGKLDEAAWEKAPWTDLFQDIEGPVKPKPTYNTRAKMLWDDNYLYIAADLVEPNLSGTLTKRDSVIFQDNDFEVFIDPNGDSHEYFELEINALNTVWDLFLGKPYKDGGAAVDAWDIKGLKHAVHLDGTLNQPGDVDRGWTVEMAIPWVALAPEAGMSLPPKTNDFWRMGFSRVEWLYEVKDGKYVKVPNRPENNWIWSPQGIVDMHRPEKWAYVHFVADAAKAGKLEDPAYALKETLHEVYYRQRDFKESKERWAASFDELGLRAAKVNDWHLSITSTTNGYTATGSLGEQVWSIRQDAKITRTPPVKAK